jgi:hypothetical protein
MANDYFLHFTAQKKRNSAKDKIKPGSAATSGSSKNDLGTLLI